MNLQFNRSGVHGRYPPARRAAAPLRLERLRFTGFDYFLVMIHFFDEIGFSYWASVPVVASLIFVIRWHRIFAKGLAGLPPFLFLIPLTFISMLVEPSYDSTQDILHIAREGMFFGLMVGFFRGLDYFWIEFDPKIYDKYIRISMIFITILVIIQTIALQRNIYIGLSADVYIEGKDMIPSDLDLRFSHIRPNGIWTEPSYLGYAMLSFMMMGECFSKPGGRDKLVFGLMIFCGMLSQALSFILFFTLMTLLSTYFDRNMAKYRTLIWIGALVAVLGILLVGSAGFVGERLSKAGSATGDLSLFFRIFGPINFLPQFLLEHPVGVPFTYRLPALLPYASQWAIDPIEFTVNAIANLLFYYGFPGGIMAYFVINGRDKLFNTFMTLSMTIQGAFLAPDKFYTTVYVALVCRWIQQKKEMDAIRRAPVAPPNVGKSNSPETA